jgi:DivIVA domain-containing protein
MIDLTPLDVRKKRGDFKKSLRGYDPLEVDGFLELVSERMEELVKANMTLEERAQRLGEQVVSLGGRERAVNEALVTAQQLRDEIRDQAQREADQIRREAEREVAQLRKEAEHDAEHLGKEARLEAKGLVADAERLLEERRKALNEMEAQRTRFLESYRQLLHRQLELVQVEESRSPLDEVAVELDLGGGRRRGSGSERPAAEVDEADGIEVEAARETTETVQGDTPPEDNDHADAWPDDDVVAEDVEADDDADAIPVEGLAPSDDDLEHEATILPDPRAAVHSMVAREGGATEDPGLRELLDEMGEGGTRDP